MIGIHIKHLLLSALLLLTPLSSVNSENDWRLLTTEDGLNSNKLLSIYQTTHGDVWIGTNEGIQRYNGIFEADSFYGLVDIILELPSGEILSRVVTSGAAFSGQSDSVSIYLFNGLDWVEPTFFEDNDIRMSTLAQFAVIWDDKLWIPSRSGLISFDGQRWRLHDSDKIVEWLV